MPQAARLFAKGRGRALSCEDFMLDGGFVGTLSDALNIELEKQIPHGGVAGDHHLVDFLSREVQPTAHFADFLIHRIHDRLVQLATKRAAIVGNAMHHITAAKALRIFKGADVSALPCFQIYQFHHDGGGSQIHSKAIQVSAKPVDQLVHRTARFRPCE